MAAGWLGPATLNALDVTTASAQPEHMRFALILPFAAVI